MNETLKNKYQDVWESRSSIRTRPRKTIDFDKVGYFFPEDKQPILFNQEIQSLGEDIKEKILIQSFYKYLHDIVNLENDSIIKVCNLIIYNKDLPINYQDEVKFNAYTIIIDEYYHIYIAQDMMNQLKHKYPNIEKLQYSTPDSQNAVNLIKTQLDDKLHNIFEIIAVCIFETTLVKELVEFFYTDNIHPSIKYYINDHMNDEAKHFGYFHDLLSYTWKNLAEEYKITIGKQMPIFIKSYLNISSEKEFNLQLLRKTLNNEQKSNTIINDLYKGFDITPEVPVVKNVLSVLKKAEILTHHEVKASFNAMGWNV